MSEYCGHVTRDQVSTNHSSPGVHVPLELPVLDLLVPAAGFVGVVVQRLDLGLSVPVQLPVLDLW